ncbi:MAG: enoyl-CoA hydratase/isomerase family protein [Betaproteobacteria bacterium]|nr:enoyl-CoA hydratase/isomerase family protein [Betaproteobacteria bacterium]MCC6249045.1 enoyl-CoA hydratase/isomerase family protein [Rubrivivax sp.]
MSATTFANPLLERVTRPPPKRVAIIGAGTIGPDIGYYLKSALPALELVLVDLKQEAIDAALARMAGYAEKAVARGKMRDADAQAVLAGVTGSTDYAALAGADWVIEAATEDLALKRRIFAAVEAEVADDAAITSNTSSLPAARLFAELKHPERATVTHFFAPAWRNPVVEVIDWPRADRALIAWLRRLFAATGKLPLVTADAPCFMLDRVFDNWCNEAAHLLGSASAAEVDTVAMAHVHAGPFFVLNLAHGNPIIVETNTLQAAEEGAHYAPAPIFGSVERWLTVAPGQRVGMPAARAAAIDDRLRGVLWSQAVDILDRGIGGGADLDIGCRLALGFKRGPLESMREAGDAEVTRVLNRFVADRPGMPRPRRALAEYQPRERHIVTDRIDDVVVVTLRRPEALNALHDEMTDEILAVVRRHEDDAAVAGFVLTGYGTKAFCAGGDIGRFPSLLGDADAAAQYARDCARLLVHLDRARKPVVAALNGLTLGGGFELAMRCHALVADRQAVMQLPEITLGILPGLGAMVVPYRRWPAAAAVFHGLLARGERLSAAQAHELGIVDELADSVDVLIERAVARVHALAGRVRPAPGGAVAVPAWPAGAARSAAGKTLSTQMVALIGRAVRDAAAAPSLAEALEVGYRAFGESACTAAAREGIAAFIERRAPDFGATG